MLFEYEFSFANRALLPEDHPKDIADKKSLFQIAEYNNQHHGIIDNNFIKWALQNNISYHAILWFIKDFSGQTDRELLWLIDAKFSPYTIYCDESSNAIKFRFKDETGKLNVDWRNDFVLAGVLFEGNIPPIDIDSMFSSLELQKTIKDAKLRHIANYNGENINRFVDILKSEKVSIVLDTILNNDIYIHWATQSLLYYALVDIVDSIIEIPFQLDLIKNILYKYALGDLECFLKLLAKYNYPNINREKIVEFCGEFISWIESLAPQTLEDDFCLEFLRQGAKTSKKSADLIFLTDNFDKLLIENFVPIYASRLGEFSSSIIHFDKCGIVEENIEKYMSIFCKIKKPVYDFLSSTDNRWIQLSDFVSAIMAAMLAFINENDIPEINKVMALFNDLQKHNLKLLMCLIRKSSAKNKYFDHMSCNFEQIERIRYLSSVADNI